MQVLIFTSMEVFSICLQSKETPKECLKLKTLLGSTPEFQVVVGAIGRKTDCMQFLGLKKKAHNPVIMEVFFLGVDQQQCTPFLRTCTPTDLGF